MKKWILLVICCMTFSIINAQPTNLPRPIGVCLSGGGALGFSHIGALQALIDAGIPIDYVSGASMGAMIGTLFCAGYDPQEIMGLIKEHKMYKLNQITSARSSRRGLLGMRHVRKLYHKLIPHNSFEKLETPMAISVTNLSTGKSEYVSTGNQLIEFTLASSSIPGVFEAPQINGQYYVDGGVLDNLPLTPLRSHCKTIIAIDALDYPTKPVIKKTKDVLLLFTVLLNEYNTQLQVRDCDWYIQCPGAEKYTIADFKAYEALYQIGYNSVKEYINNKY